MPEAKAEPTAAPPNDDSPRDIEKPEPTGTQPGDAPSPAAQNEPAPAPAKASAPARTAETTSPPPSPSSPPPAKQLSAQPAQADAAPQSPLNVGQLNSRALSLPKPLYPETARRMRVEGAVKVLVTIDVSGRVISARAESGNVLLRESAVKAARLARFTPALVSGQAVAVSGFITYTFSL
jgi:protein TonB